MTRGRFLSRSISLSEQVDELINTEGYEASTLITWMISHLDIEGRMKGSLKSVKGTVLPLRDDISSDKIASILREADRLGLLKWYEHESEQYIWFPKFAEHQQGLRKKREASSKVPEYSGSSPGVVPPKVREGKVSKDKSREDKTRKDPAPLPSTSKPKPTARADVLEVFDHYRKYHPRAHKKPSPDSKEWKHILARFGEGYAAEDLRRAIDGCHLSEWHMGKNDRGKRYDTLELITRDGSKVQGFLETAQHGDCRPVEPGKKRTYLDVTREILEEADRDGLPQFSVLMAKLRARYGIQQTDPAQWTATLLAYFEETTKHDDEAVTKALDTIWKEHREWFPTLGLLMELVEMHEKSKTVRESHRLTQGEPFADQGGAAKLRSIISDLAQSKALDAEDDKHES